MQCPNLLMFLHLIQSPSLTQELTGISDQWSGSISSMYKTVFRAHWGQHRSYWPGNIQDIQRRWCTAYYELKSLFRIRTLNTITEPRQSLRSWVHSLNYSAPLDGITVFSNNNTNSIVACILGSYTDQSMNESINESITLVAERLQG